MKKQILILVCLVMVTFATTSVFGQAGHVSAPEAAPTCPNDALHPFAGKPYDYTVSSDGTGAKYTWWATTNQSFITAGVLQNTGANVLVTPDAVPTTAANYNTSGGSASPTIQLTWGTNVLAAAMDLTTPVPAFVSVYTAGTSCSDNIKVFQVEPVNGFTVDIKNVINTSLATTLAYGAAEVQCFDKVKGASWATNHMIYNYGTNVLVFEVVAANFSGTWTPTFTLSGVDAAQNATMVWDYTTAFGAPVSVASGVVSGTPVSTTVTNTSIGVSIFVKVTILNQTFEGTSNLPISLGVTGTNSAGQRDVLATTCLDATLASNTAVQTLNKRPIITNSTVVGTFEMP